MKHQLPFIIAALSIVFYLFGIHIQAGSTEGIMGHLFYPFCHVSIFHLLGNLIALHSICASTLKNGWRTWLSAYIISAIVPCYAPTEGMSGLLYAEMGILSWQVAIKWKFHLWCAGFMAVCFLFPNAINGWIHVYCYAAGVCLEYAALTISRWRRR